MSLVVSNTPIEQYSINGHTVYVKRDDLCTNHPLLPHMAKVRGIVPYLEKLKAEGIDAVGICITPISRAGQAVAVICQELDLTCYVYVRSKYPMLTTNMRAPQHMAVTAAEGTLFVLRLPTTNAVYEFAKQHALSNRITLLPRYLALPETVEAVRQEAMLLPVELTKGTIVVCVGSGTILAGIVAAVNELPEHIIGVMVGDLTGTRHRIQTLLTPYDLLYNLANMQLVPSSYQYYQTVVTSAPFNCDSYYDSKAWKWLVDNIGTLRKPILFWNIG